MASSIADVIVRQRVEGADLSRIPAQLRAIPAEVPIRVLFNRTALDQGLQRVLSDISAFTGRAQPVISPRVDASSLDRLGSATRSVDTASRSAAQSAQIFERALRQEAQSEIQNALAHNDFARALRLVSAEEAAAVGNKTRLNQLDTQRTRILDQQANAAEKAARAEARANTTSAGGLPVLPRSVEFFGPGAVGQLTSVAGALGIATSAAEAFNLAVDSGRAGLALRQQQRITEQLAGSTAAYTRIVATARAQQDLWGGTLQENIAGLQGLVVSARSSGASLEQLISLSQRLSVLDPAQGAEGARVALSEAVAGDPSSLARRYEIPRSALEKLKDESLSTTDRLNVLDQYLARIGITSGVVAGAVDETTRSYNQLAAARDAVKTDAGAGVADFFAPLARGAAELLTSGQRARAELQAQASAAFAVSNSYAEYEGNIQRVTSANSGMAFSVAKLSAAQFAAAQQIAASGQASATDAATKVSQLGTLDNLVQQYGGYNSVLGENAARILQIAAASPAAATSLQALIGQIGVGGFTAEQFIAQLSQMEGWLRLKAEASADAARRQGEHNIAIGDATAALQQSIAQSALDDAQSKVLAQSKADLALQAQGAAREILATGNASAVAVAQMARITGLAPALIQSYIDIERAARAAAIAQAGASAAAQNIYDDAGNVIPGRGNRLPPGAGGQAQAAIATRDATEAQILATGTYAQQLAVLAKQRDRYVAGTAGYINAETRILQLKKAHNTAGGGSATYTPDERVQLASGKDVQDLALLEQKLAGLTKGTKEYATVFERIQVLKTKLAKTDGTAAAKSLADAQALHQAQLALMDDESKLAALKADRSAAPNETERLRLTAQINQLDESISRRRFALLTPEQQLVELRRQQADTSLSDLERAELADRVLGLEREITNERKAQADAALSAQKAIIEDRQKDREDARKAADAEAVLRSSSASAELKAAAQDALDLLRIEDQQRASNIAELQQKAGGAPAAALAPANQPGRVTGGPANVPQLSTQQAQEAAAAGAAAAQSAARAASDASATPASVGNGDAALLADYQQRQIAEQQQTNALIAEANRRQAAAAEVVQGGPASVPQLTGAAGQLPAPGPIPFEQPAYAPPLNAYDQALADELKRTRTAVDANTQAQPAVSQAATQAGQSPAALTPAQVQAVQALPVATPAAVPPLQPVLDSPLIASSLADALYRAVVGWTVNVDADDPLVELLRSGESVRAGGGY